MQTSTAQGIGFTCSSPLTTEGLLLWSMKSGLDVGWEKLILCALLRHPSCSSCVGWLSMHRDCLLILHLYFLWCSVSDHPSPVFPGGIKGLYQTHSFQRSQVTDKSLNNTLNCDISFQSRAAGSAILPENIAFPCSFHHYRLAQQHRSARKREIHDTTGVKWRRKYVERKRLKRSLN